jgi:hypothetical protein
MAAQRRQTWNLDHRGGIGRAGPRGGRAGRGTRGSRRRKGGQPCRDFQQTGHCKYADLCTYSHDPPLGLNSGPLLAQPRERLEETPEQRQAKADYNSWKRLIKKEPTANDTRTIELLWNGALGILNGDDRDWKQMLPRDLDDGENYGRHHIQTLLSMVPHAHGYSKFVELARPFLLVIAHPALIGCLSVDTFVGGLYNFISGSNGSRAIPFFQRLCTSLLTQHLEVATHTSTEEQEATLIAISTALRELLKREQRANFHEELPVLVDLMENVIQAIDIDSNSRASQLLRNGIGELRGMIARANGLLQQKEELQVGGVSTAAVTSTYPRDLILPRDRHDNDKMDITKIKLLPTEDEIRSNHVEFLPSTDLDQPHFLTDPVGRHLDTLFRLLRHDVFGELSEALGRVLLAIGNDPTVIEDPKFHFDNIRAYSYPTAHIRYMSFDQRRGLETQISFPQPFPVRKKSASERRTWWEESKRLLEGVLLCLIFVQDIGSSLLFFTVSEKCIDPTKEFGLSYDKHQATIKARLATRRQKDLELMTRLSCKNRRGLLVEFPDVLLATFVPILENLQYMQRLSRLPFHLWILPDRLTPQGALSTAFNVPPPLYARGSGFSFSLSPILKDPSDDMSIPSAMPVGISAAIEKLEARTVLDRGQCEALIAALTREFVLIQGPPGTGKSYLGVQVLRVLLTCQEKATLGPIVIM